MGEHVGGLILIATGSTLRAEQMDRPLAYYLQTQIDELGAGHEDRLALVISDRYYLTHPDLHELPLISIGGPGVNRVAKARGVPAARRQVLHPDGSRGEGPARQHLGHGQPANTHRHCHFRRTLSAALRQSLLAAADVVTGDIKIPTCLQIVC